MSHEATPQESELEELAGYLNALAHPRRLELLAQLRIPRTMGEIQLKPWRNESEGNPDRAISRTAVQRHMGLLTAIGVVRRREANRDGRAVDEYVLQRARLFQVVEELRRLTKLRSIAADALDATASAARTRARPQHVRGPHLVVLSGPAEGTITRLEGAGPWPVGRAADAAVALDYDPYVSSQQATIERDAKGTFHVRDLPSNRNSTELNWTLLPRGDVAPLRTGDVIGVGRSLLLFRDGA